MKINLNQDQRDIVCEALREWMCQLQNSVPDDLWEGSMEQHEMHAQAEKLLNKLEGRKDEKVTNMVSGKRALALFTGVRK